jgi:hypothetical protein
MPNPLFRPGDIPSGLQGYWKLDEASGSRADSGPNGNTLTDNNTVGSVTYDYWKTSGTNSAYFINSNSEYLSIAHASQVGLGYTSTFSFAFWMKASDGLTVEVFAKVNPGNNDGYRLRINTLGQLDLWINGTEYPYTAFRYGEWYHIVINYDDANDLITYWLNGNQVYGVASALTPNANTAPFRIGFYDGDNTYYGILKDFATWNRVLTPLEIKSLAMGVDLSNKSVRPSTYGPTHHWKLNEYSGNRADSVTSNPITLTDNGATGSSAGFLEGRASILVPASSQYFSAADSADWDFTGGIWSLSCWIKVGTVKNYNMIWTNRTDDNNYAQFYSDVAGGFGFQVISGGATIVDVQSQSGLYNVGYWLHVAVTESGDTYKIYVNGINRTVSGGTDTDRLANYTGQFRLGAGPLAAVANFFDGTICDFGIWKGTALAQDQVRKISSAFPIQQEGIVSYWKMDEASGTRVDTMTRNNLTDNNSVGSAAGKVGTASYFIRANSEYLSIANGSQTRLNLTNSGYTLLTWVKLNTVGIDQYLFSKTNAAGTGYHLRISSAANVLSIANEPGGASTSTFGLGATGAWYHIAVVWTAGKMRFYYMGGLQNDNAYTSALSADANQFTLGTRSDNVNYLDGYLDETLVADRWFREEEIVAVVNKNLQLIALDTDPSPSNLGGFFHIF